MHPKITCHMIASVDGRLLPERWSHGTIKETSDLIHRAYDQSAERLGGDGWMVGRNTMASYADGERVPAPMSTLVVRESFKGKRGKRKLAIAIDPFGKLVFAGHELDGDHVVMILSECVEDTYLADLRSKGISYVFAGPDGRNLRKAMKTLHCLFGVREILLQGGGQINGAFLAAGLIDEFSTLVFPAIDGMHATPSIVDYQGKDTQEPAAGLRLRLIPTRRWKRAWCGCAMPWNAVMTHQNMPEPQADHATGRLGFAATATMPSQIAGRRSKR